MKILFLLLLGLTMPAGAENREPSVLEDVHEVVPPPTRSKENKKETRPKAKATTKKEKSLAERIVDCRNYWLEAQITPDWKPLDDKGSFYFASLRRTEEEVGLFYIVRTLNGEPVLLVGEIPEKSGVLFTHQGDFSAVVDVRGEGKGASLKEIRIPQRVEKNSSKGIVLKTVVSENTPEGMRSVDGLKSVLERSVLASPTFAAENNGHQEAVNFLTENSEKFRDGLIKCHPLFYEVPETGEKFAEVIHRYRDIILRASQGELKPFSGEVFNPALDPSSTKSGNDIFDPAAPLEPAPIPTGKKTRP